MKKLFILLMGICVFMQSYTQDNVWLAGAYVSGPGVDSTFGILKLDFNVNSITQSVIYKPMYFGLANVAISDNDNNLLFSTNGFTVFNKECDTMVNGEVFNQGGINNLSAYPYCMPTPQSIIALPNPKYPHLHYLIHHTLDTPYVYGPGMDDIAYPANHLDYSVIDMSKDSGRGVVIRKDIRIFEDTICLSGVTAVKHANGKDWWVLALSAVSSAYHRVLVRGDSIYHYPIASVQGWTGLIYPGGGGGAAVFSPDGTKYVFYDGTHVWVFDFDRCTGLLSNRQLCGVKTQGLQGTVISPNSKLLYIAINDTIYQYNLAATNLCGSQQVVAVWDGYYCTFPQDSTNQIYNGSLFNAAQLAPDGKIYIGSIGATNVFHIIHSPDSLGVACNVEQHGLVFPVFTQFSFPHYPNYRLGAASDTCVVAGVSLPTLSSDITIYPNPADDVFQIVTTSKTAQVLKVYDIWGREVFSTHFNLTLTVPTEKWAAGVYTCKAAGVDGSKPTSHKIIVIH